MLKRKKKEEWKCQKGKKRKHENVEREKTHNENVGTGKKIKILKCGNKE